MMTFDQIAEKFPQLADAMQRRRVGKAGSPRQFIVGYRVSGSPHHLELDDAVVDNRVHVFTESTWYVRADLEYPRQVVAVTYFESGHFVHDL